MTMHIAPVFSIVVSTHRRPAILERALQSLLAQSFRDFEIVLVADEGTAATKEVASRLLRETDVFLCLPGAKGPAESRNAGAQLARGRFVLFLDDDDSYRPDFLQAIVQCNRFRSDAVNYVSYSQVREMRTAESTQVISSTDIDMGGTDIRGLLVSNFIPNNTIILSSSIAKRHLVDAALQSHEDWDYLISLVVKYDFNFLGISGPVVHINEGQSRNNDAKSQGSIALDYLSIYRKWPASDDDLRLRRKEMLRTLGLDLPPAML